jgi:CheY-like chemotaxis protein
MDAGRYLRLAISDIGQGMDHATLKKSIEPFFSTKPVGKGTGLGLSMVHGLAMQLGGSLELKSKVGQGTTAILWFPVAGVEAAMAEAAAPLVLPPASQPARILLVDDDPLIAASTGDMLEDLGHSVIERNSGPAAIDVLMSREPIDLMLTDYAMPGMTGVELAATARKLRPDMPILLATGYADIASASTIDLPRLAKPYLQSQLRCEIDRLLAEKRASDRGAGETVAAPPA